MTCDMYFIYSSTIGGDLPAPANKCTFYTSTIIFITPIFI